MTSGLVQLARSGVWDALSLQGVTPVFAGLQGVTPVFAGLQGVTPVFAGYGETHLVSSLLFDRSRGNAP